MTKIKLEIKTCQECPFFKKERHYTEDSFEIEYNWYCMHPSIKVKEIAMYVEWHEESKTPIPDWCPAKV